MDARKVFPAAAAAALSWVAAASLAREAPVIKRDRQFYSKGSFVAYASPWGDWYDKSLKMGVTFDDRITIYPSSFPAKSVIAWRWPLTPARFNRPYGYMALSFGSYAGGTPRVAIPARRVADIATLRQDFTWTHAYGPGYNNLLTEFFLTRQPGQHGTRVLEVGWFLHLPPSTSAFVNAGKQVGTFVDRYGRAWQVALNGTFCTFAPVDRAEILSGSIDMKEALLFLQAKKVVTGAEWFSGLGFGVEPISGNGSITVHRWSITYN